MNKGVKHPREEFAFLEQAFFHTPLPYYRREIPKGDKMLMEYNVPHTSYPF